MDLSESIRIVLLCIVFIQLYLALRLLKANIASRLYGEIHEVHKAFIQYPLLRPYFFHKTPLVLNESDDPKKNNMEEYYRARAFAEMFFDIFEHIYVLRTESDSILLKHIHSSASNIPENWDGYIDGMIASSPFLSSYLIEVQENIFPQSLQLMVKQRVKEHWPELVSDSTKKDTSKTDL
jgi:hypothetical protein